VLVLFIRLLVLFRIYSLVNIAIRIYNAIHFYNILNLVFRAWSCYIVILLYCYIVILWLVVSASSLFRIHSLINIAIYILKLYIHFYITFKRCFFILTVAGDCQLSYRSFIWLCLRTMVRHILEYCLYFI